MKKPIKDLKPHPRNEEVYGYNEDVSELKEKIRKSGIVTTLIINDSDVIISGNRRWKSCKQLVAEGDTRFCQVNCEVKEFESEEDELEYLIICNDTRDKSMEQKAREAEMLLEVERIRAEKRKLAGVKVDLPPISAEGSNITKGESRNIVAEKLHMRSGQEVDRAVKSIKKIDELKAQGRNEDSELIRTVLNENSPSTAADLSYVIDKVSEDDKQAIREKKTSANKVIEKVTGRAEKRKAKKQEVETQSESQIDPENKFLSIKEIIADIKDPTRDRTLTEHQVALTIESNVKQLMYGIDTLKDEPAYNNPITNKVDKEIISATINQLKGLVEVLENIIK